jgi:hypothetical protein
MSELRARQVGVGGEKKEGGRELEGWRKDHWWRPQGSSSEGECVGTGGVIWAMCCVCRAWARARVTGRLLFIGQVRAGFPCWRPLTVCRWKDGK